ncbi:MAG: ParB/RepB/Spo0J family partition protein [Chloroflexi bacterium]|nr:ParB/RepB/Spo0J family partition protein [Chloroflexota bacterium]
MTRSGPQKPMPAQKTAARVSPLAERIAQRQQGAIGRGGGALLGSPTEPPACAPPGEREAAEHAAPQGVNRSALLSRLQGTHQPQLNRGFYGLLRAAGPGDPEAADPEEVVASEYRVVLVATDALEPNPYLPHVPVAEAELERLAQNLREQGILEPLQVIPAAEGGTRRYWVISGEQRRLAAIRAGFPRVPVIIREVSPRAGLQMSLARYLHPGSRSVLDRARAFAMLTAEMGMTVQEVAVRVGAAAEQVATEIRLLELEDAMQESLRQGHLTVAQASVLLNAPDQPTRRALWEYARRYRPSPERMHARLERMQRSAR